MKKNDIEEIMNILIKTYPDAKCSLNFNTPFELLVSVILSAQCTDERVNKTMADVYLKYSTPEDFANMDILFLEDLIRPCGFYKNKAKNIKLTSKKIIDEFNGQVPNNMNDLLTLNGVGRKTANVIMLEAFNNPQGIAVDTHCKRLSNRIGFSDKKDPLDIENDLIKQIPKEYFKDINHIFMWHGRNTCTAQNPKCENCTINHLCEYYKELK